jgi:hypothetical protein
LGAVPSPRPEVVAVLVQGRTPEVGVVAVEACVVAIDGPAEVGPPHRLLVAVDRVVVVEEVVGVVDWSVVAQLSRIGLPYRRQDVRLEEGRLRRRWRPLLVRPLRGEERRRLRRRLEVVGGGGVVAVCKAGDIC